MIADLLQSIAAKPDFRDLLARLEGEDAHTLSLGGLTLAAKGLAIALLWHRTGKNMLVLTDGNREAETLLEAVNTFLTILLPNDGNARAQIIPALDVLPHQKLTPHSEILEQRAIGLWKLSTNRAPITLAPVASAMLRVAAPSFYRQLVLTLKENEEVSLDDLSLHLRNIGYEQSEPVSMVGEFSIRGGIVDIFPAEAEKPVRLEFFGDAIETIRRFDVDTQRSVARVPEVRILPLIETRTDTDGPREFSLLNLVGNGLLLWDEPEQVRASAERFWKRLDDGAGEVDPDEHYFHFGELASHGANLMREIELRELALEVGNHSFELGSRPGITFRGNIRLAVEESRTLVQSGFEVVFFAKSLGEVERFADVFSEYKVPYQVLLPPDEAMPQYLADRVYVGAASHIYLIKGRLTRGAVFRDPKLALFGSDDLFESSDTVARSNQRGPVTSMGAFAADIADLKVGDFVVHQTHGVGKFLGIKVINQGEGNGEFLLLEYSGESKLYVPVTRLDLISKYRSGGGETKAPLDRLGGVTWQKTKSRVKAKMRDMADELLKLYAQRRMAEGFAFSPDSNWQREFEDSFEYNATKDQVAAVRDIKRDMESETAMDRLVVGDVGFGKTEVAMRAAFKALGDGKQVAVLAPTTVLAFQHFESFKRRFASFPVRIEHLSRFRNPKESKQVIEDMDNGKVDILIGTHRILSKDIRFPDLGLLIVDEEQRFGVAHKERLKQLKKNVDVLTLSATPIPRTLHMSLVGIRDLSVIETPPKDRLAVHTVVAKFDQQVIKTAIEQEIARGGMVYFVHNRVESIYERAFSIQELVPGVRVGVGHGQMVDEELERVLLGFMKHEFDVFVCTTIVENGLDIPLANTIIIENAQNYGLSELYQLRGRVGRSNRRAYAYLLVPTDTELTEVARKRLAALKEFSDLGAGFKIAALDLELRGAGSLLGGEQSGHINAVGFDMYIRMLEEAVQEMKGIEVPLEIHSTLNLGFEIRIPTSYIPEDNQRLRAYKKIADAKSREVANELVAEFADRYGPVPPDVRLLVDFGQAKNLAQQVGVESVERRQGIFQIKFHEKAKIDPQKLMEYIQREPGASFSPTGILRAGNTTGASPEAIVDALHALLDELRYKPLEPR
ncbi:transcription-repair coupling factor [Bryobacter aggregatus]|uniref:transcription-repair coupling factor n=1 Tax=Bryobacter aggregatus TaxID=360054 RepID=UPI000A887535|nr:transcription-repair coupling factor [Bryobacter aggregatus]